MVFLCQRAIRIFGLVMLCSLVIAHAEEDPAANFLSAYTEFQSGEKLERDGDFSKALAKYRAAASALQQLAQRSPEWQPMVVEYRLKKVQEGVQRLQGQASAPSPNLSDPVGDLPVPDLPVAPARSVTPDSRVPNSGTSVAQASGLRQELQAAQQTINDLRDKLNQSNSRVRKVSEDIDRLKVKLVEKDAQLSQTLNQLATLKKDGANEKASLDAIRKEFLAEVEGLKKRLEVSEADKEVLEDENSRLMVKLEKASAYIKESDAIRTTLEKERKAFAADRMTTTSRIEKGEGELQKALAELAESREQIAAVEKLSRENQELEKRLLATQKQLDREKERAVNGDKATQEAAKLVAETQKKALEASRVLAQNKELISQLAESELKLQDFDLVQKEKAVLFGEKEALERSLATKSEELEAATRQLSQQPASGASSAPDSTLAKSSKELEEKLAEAEQKVVEYQKAQSDKEAQVKEMQSQMNSVSDRLFAVRADLMARDTRIADLEKQLDVTSGDLAKLKLNQSTSPDQKQAIAENEILRGIIVRQIREQARKDQAKRLVDEEIARLQISSDALSKQLQVLAEPFQLSDEEKKMFRAPIELAEDASLEAPVALELAVTKDAANEAPVPPPAPPRKVGGIDSLKEENQSLARAAKTAFDDGDTAGAEKIYQQIVDTEPNNPYALSQLGAVQFESGKITAAEVALKKSLELVPDDPFALTILGIVHYRQQKLEESISKLEKAIEVDPKRAMSYNYLGIVYSERNNLQRAEEMLQKAIEVKPDYADAHFNLAIIYASQKPPAKELARQHYQKATRMGAPPDPSLERMMQ